MADREYKTYEPFDGLSSPFAKYNGSSELRKVAEEAMKYSCSRQEEDGSWLYEEHPQWNWIDNFHTGYNLDNLKCYIENTDDDTYPFSS